MKKKLLIALPVTALLVALSLYAAAYFRVKQLLDAQLQQLVAGGTYEKADYDQLQLSPLGNVTVAQLRLQQPDMEIVINSTRVSDIDLFHETPWHLNVAIDGIHFPAGIPNLSGTGNPLFEALLDDLVQDDTLNLHMEYGYRYDPTQSEQIISSGAVTLPGYFELAGETETRNVPLGTFAALDAADATTASALQTELLQTAALPHASLQLKDSGLIQILVNVMADSYAMPPDAMRDQLKSQLQNYYLFLPGNLQTFGQQTGQQLSDFVEGNRTLTLTVTPAFNGELAKLQPEVMGMMLTGSFDKAVELLQIEISVE